MINANMESAKLAHRSYTDLNALQDIRRQDRAGAIQEVARQFEAIYLQMMFKSMREANAVFSEGNFLNSSEMKFHQESLDKQLSLSLSEGKGIGLAEALIKNMSQQYGKSDDVASSTDSETKQSLQYYFDHPVSNYPVSSAAPTVGNVKITVDTRDNDIKSPQSFVQMLWPLAQKAGELLGVDPRAILAQSALETGWGNSVSPDGDKNFFGIKADAQWSGSSINRQTLEHRNGLLQTERAQFRQYDSYAESFIDYAGFLKSNPRYQNALQAGDDPHQFARELQSAGYATDPHYAKKISSILNGDVLNSALSTVVGEG